MRHRFDLFTIDVSLRGGALDLIFRPGRSLARHRAMIAAEVPTADCWYIDINEAIQEPEIEFLRKIIYLRDLDFRIPPMTAMNRFSNRVLLQHKQFVEELKQNLQRRLAARRSRSDQDARKRTLGGQRRSARPGLGILVEGRRGIAGSQDQSDSRLREGCASQGNRSAPACVNRTKVPLSCSSSRRARSPDPGRPCTRPACRHRETRTAR